MSFWRGFFIMAQGSRDQAGDSGGGLWLPVSLPVQLPIFSPESALESELENGGNMGIILNPQEDGADDATSRKEIPG